MTKTAHDSATPALGQQVITAVAFIHRQNDDGETEVFLPKRAATKAFLPNLYEMIGGHIDFGEDIVDGLKREVMEEIGMEVTVGDPFAVFTYVNAVKGSHSIEVVYFAQFVGNEHNIAINPDDHSGYKWFTRKQVIDHEAEITPPKDDSSTIETGDPEFQAMLKGFDILAGGSYRTA